MRILSTSPEQTARIGETLGPLLESGTVVALIGELGSGKTVFAQGLARGLGVDPDEYVSSPSFTLVNQYRGKVPVFHVDTYRLGDEAEMVALGYEDFFDPNGVTIIEWADKVRTLLPETRVVVKFRIVDEHSREIEFKLVGSWPARKAAETMDALSRG